MIVTASQVLVMAFGVAICALSAWGILAPARLIGFVKDVAERDSGFYAAILVRMVLGIALLLTAASSRFPLSFRIIGWIAILAAVGVAIIGRQRLRRFASWFDRFPPGLVRLWLILGIAFGCFLIYGPF